MWHFLGKQIGSEPSLVGQFKSFVTPHGGIIDLAVYAALYTLASALVDNIILPIMGFFSINTYLSNLAITLKEPVAGSHGETVRAAVVLNIGSFLQALLNFILVAFIFFAVAQGCSAVCRGIYRFLGKKFSNSLSSSRRRLRADVPAVRATRGSEKSQEEILIEIRDLLRQLNTKRRISVK